MIIWACTHMVQMIRTDQLCWVSKCMCSQVPLIPSIHSEQLNSRLWITINTKFCHPNGVSTACRDRLDANCGASTGWLKLLVVVIDLLNVIERLSRGTTLMCQMEVVCVNNKSVNPFRSYKIIHAPLLWLLTGISGVHMHGNWWSVPSEDLLSTDILDD